MSKLRTKNRSEIEYLRGVIREKDKIIRRLTKQLRSAKKFEYIQEEIDTPLDRIENSYEDEQLCPKCGKGHLLEIDLIHLKVIRCELCQHAESLKPDGTKTDLTGSQTVANSKTKKRE
jgi:hypothetical protein